MSDQYLTPKKTPLQWAAANLSDSAFKTFVVLFSHVDHRGVCFPGFRRLSEMARHELDCVWLEMQEIMGFDLVREIQSAKRDEFGRWTPALYQVNPDFLYLLPKNLPEALGLWDSVEQTIEQKVPVGFLPSKVPLESAESSPTGNAKESAESGNAIKQQQQTDFSSNREEGGMSAGQIAAWQSQREAQQRKPEQDNAPEPQREAPNSAVRSTKTPPVPASPLKYEPLTPLIQPLPGDDETLAERIRDEMKAPLKVARALVYKFGYVGVLNAMSAEFVANAKKPFGAMRHLLEQQQLEPNEQISTRRIDGIIR